MSSDTLVSVQHLSRYYGGLCAVNDISFSVERGQILGFLGPNGAGKSTTMQVITGALAPSIGQISIAGFDLLEQPIHAKAVLGYLPEQPPLYKEMRVREFLQFCAQLRRIPRTKRVGAIANVVERCGLQTVLNRLIGDLSKGFQQRVGIAQAIIHNPMVVILDEPTIGLDPIQMREIRALIRQLGEAHSVILSTHILSDVQAVCSHVQIIHQGEIVLHDTITGLFTHMQSTYLQVGLRYPPDEQTLRDIDGIETVEFIEDTRIKIRHAADYSPAEALVIQSVANQWGLYELIPEQHSLEQIFVDLTHTEAPEIM